MNYKFRKSKNYKQKYLKLSINLIKILGILMNKLNGQNIMNWTH